VITGTTTSASVIDLHTHILPERWPDWTARSGYAGWIELAHERPGCARMTQTLPGGGKQSFREIQANCWDPPTRLREMNARSVDIQVLSTVPIMFSYWALAPDALDLARLLNDHIAGVCRDHPGRFIGLATLPMQDPLLACRELDRCMNQLGLAGIEIGTHVNGHNLDTPGIEEVLAHAAALGAAVFVHPWDMLRHSTIEQMVELPTGEAARAIERTRSSIDRMERHWMPWLVGMPTETTIAMMSVLFGGVLDRHPSLRLCFAHAGGSLPGTLGRIEHGLAARPDLFPENARSPRHDLSRVWVDSLTHDADALRHVVQLFGAERVALGSDYPFPLGEDHPGQTIRSIREFTPQQQAQLLGGAAKSFLGR